MEMLTDEERLKFFKYVTGRDSVPYEGITGLKDKLKIVLDIQPQDIFRQHPRVF